MECLIGLGMIAALIYLPRFVAVLAKLGCTIWLLILASCIFAAMFMRVG